MKKITSFLIIIIVSASSFAQSLSVETSVLAGSKDQLPFWLWANQLGRYQPDEDFIGALELTAGDFYTPSEALSWNWGTRVNGNLSNESALFLSELYGKLQWKFLQFSMGKWAEDEQFGGLSISNGNISSSLNARPHPRLQMGTNGFQYLIPARLAVLATYEEGLLDDDRYVEDTHLHHKRLLIKYAAFKNSLELTAGLYHYVMWGGTHPTYDKLPGWSDYFKYVTGSAGGSNAVDNDQENVLGNQYGNYLFQVDWHLKEKDLSFYFSHPFEDHSGMELRNPKDNLYGACISSPSPKALIQTIVVEYFYTKHQSGSLYYPNGTRDPSGGDDYLNNYLYKGAVYHGQVMGAPFFGFIPTTGSASVLSNRISGFNLGLKGYIKSNYTWRCQLTRFKNFGSYYTVYQPAREQFSALARIEWNSPRIPLVLGISAAFDSGSAWDEGKDTSRFGGKLSLRYLLR